MALGSQCSDANVQLHTPCVWLASTHLRVCSKLFSLLPNSQCHMSNYITITTCTVWHVVWDERNKVLIMTYLAPSIASSMCTLIHQMSQQWHQFRNVSDKNGSFYLNLSSTGGLSQRPCFWFPAAPLFFLSLCRFKGLWTVTAQIISIGLRTWVSPIYQAPYAVMSSDSFKITIFLHSLLSTKCLHTHNPSHSTPIEPSHV